MKYRLVLQPIHNSSANILRCFANDKPITSDQMDYLYWHEVQLSSPTFDPILQYYLKSMKDHRKRYKASYLLPHEEMTLQDTRQLKKRIMALLQNKNGITHVVLNLTPKQLAQFNDYTIQELIFWHGNHFLTNDPFIPGGITPVIYFQWGNLFGIVKYVVVPGEKQLKGNILVYFEDMQERNLDECVNDYNLKLKNEIGLQKEMLGEKIISTPDFENKIITAPALSPEKETLYKTPTPRISDHFLIKHI